MRTPQAPLSSGFGAASTAAEVIRGRDLTGKLAIVTGGYAGIGLVTTRTLVAAGAHVIVPARDHEKAARALAGLDVELAALDLIEPASIDAFATSFLASQRALDLLINNAGIMATPLVRDARGYESQFATNHLGHHQLTARLWPALRRANGARIVALSSVGHRRGQVDFEDPSFQHRPYDKWLAYGQAKTANALFAVYADEVGAPDGIRAFSVHPGGVLSDLIRHLDRAELPPGVFDANGQPIIDPERNQKTPEMGAATTIWCATSPQLAGLGGVYCENCDIAAPAVADSPALRGVRPYATDPELASRLSRLSQALTGVALG